MEGTKDEHSESDWQQKLVAMDPGLKEQVLWEILECLELAMDPSGSVSGADFTAEVLETLSRYDLNPLTDPPAEA